MRHTFPVRSEPLEFEGLAVDLRHNLATRSGVSVGLGPVEAEMLYILVARAPEYATLADFDAGLYGQLDAPNNLERLVSERISRLRPKLAAIGVFIPRVRETGYRLELVPIISRAAA